MPRFTVAFVLSLALAACSGSAPAETGADTPAAVAENAPPVTVPVNGNTHSLEGIFQTEGVDLTGKVAVVDFWATWCAPCIQEIPNYNEIRAKYKDRDFEMLGVTIESGPIADIRPKVDEYKIDYPVVLGTDEVAADFGGVIGFPTTFILDKQGNVAKKILGLPPDKKEQIEAAIEELLAR